LCCIKAFGESLALENALLWKKEKLESEIQIIWIAFSGIWHFAIRFRNFGGIPK